jgi:hypothetical protein
MFAELLSSLAFSFNSRLLILGSSDVDATNQNYFGETSLHYLVGRCWLTLSNPS